MEYLEEFFMTGAGGLERRNAVALDVSGNAIAADGTQPIGVAISDTAVDEWQSVASFGLVNAQTDGALAVGAWVGASGPTTIAALVDPTAGALVKALGVALETVDAAGGVVKILLRPCVMSYPIA
jgi:hypothetical protein